MTESKYELYSHSLKFHMINTLCGEVLAKWLMLHPNRQNKETRVDIERMKIYRWSMATP